MGKTKNTHTEESMTQGNTATIEKHNTENTGETTTYMSGNLNWILDDMNESELPPPPTRDTTNLWNIPMPEVTFGITTEDGKFPGFVCKVNLEKQNPFLDSPTFGTKENVKRIRMIPIRTYRQNTVWKKTGLKWACLHEDPTNFGPPVGMVIPKGDKSYQVRDNLSLVYYDIDKKGFYEMNLSSDKSRREGQLLDWVLSSEAKQGIAPFSNLYIAMVYPETNSRSGATFYHLRILREADSVMGGKIDNISVDLTPTPTYMRVDLASEPKLKEHLEFIKETLRTGTREAAAIRLAGLNGQQANRCISKFEAGEMSLEEIMTTKPEVQQKAETAGVS